LDFIKARGEQSEVDEGSEIMIAAAATRHRQGRITTLKKNRVGPTKIRWKISENIFSPEFIWLKNIYLHECCYNTSQKNVRIVFRLRFFIMEQKG